jgi:hypothetical protein
MVIAINPHPNLIHLLLIKKRSQYEIRSIMIWTFENKYYFHQVEDYLLSNRVSHTYLSQDCMSEKKDLNNYHRLINPREHDHKLKFGSIIDFYDICTKLTSHFSINILAKTIIFNFFLSSHNKKIRTLKHI